jgi:hypothetical protein
VTETPMPWGAAQELPSALGDPWGWLERANTVPVSGSVLVAGRRSLVNGFSFTEISGVNPATVQLISGQTATGVIVATITLAANESSREYIPWPFILFKYGIFANVVSGAIVGSVSSLTIPD